MAASAAPASARGVLHRRAFWLLWPAQLISTAGSALAALAASIIVYQETRSALGVGLMLVAAALPGLVVGLFSGTLLTRVDRKGALLALALARVVLLLLIPILLPHSLAWLYLLVLLESAATQLYDPAYASAVSQMTSARELAAAQTLLQVGRFTATAIGFVTAGMIASGAIVSGAGLPGPTSARFPLAWAFYLDAATCALSALSVALVPVPPGRHVAPESSSQGATRVLANLRAGMRTVRQAPALRSLLLLSLPAFIGLGLTNALLLPFTQRALHAAWWQYGLQEALTALGFLVGSLLVRRAAAHFHEGQLLTVSFLGIALAFVWYSRVSSVPLALGLMTVTGLFNAPSVLARTHLIQRHTSHEARRQVAGLFFVVRSLCFLIGMAAAGLADLFAVRGVLLAASLILLLAGLLALVAPGLRQSAEEWRQGLRLLRRAESAPGIGAGRPVSGADLDVLSRRWPVAGELSLAHLQRLMISGRVYDVAPGTRIVRAGERGTSAYFLLRGRVVVGRAQAGRFASSAMLCAGDFFGEIAALTASPRTADVVAAQPTTVLEFPAATLRELMTEEPFGRQVLSRMTARLVVTQAADLPREAALCEESLTTFQAAPGVEEDAQVSLRSETSGPHGEE